MKKINFTTKFTGTKRSCAKNWDLSFNINSQHAQIQNINQLYMNNTCENETIFRSQLKKKLNSYKSQDEKKNRYECEEFMTIEKLLELLVISKLKCYYCKNDVLILYNELYDKKQWTLDRIDNSIGHNCNNCVISCLQCNVQRRVMDDEKFRFSKQMKIVKNTDKDNNTINNNNNNEDKIKTDKRHIKINNTKIFTVKKV